MEKLTDCLMLKFKPDTLQIVRKIYDLDQPGRIENAIDILEEWIKKQNHFLCREFDRDYLERAIIFNKGSVERAKSRLDRMCALRTLMPEFFQRCEVRNEVDCADQGVLPNLTPNGQRVYILKMRENAEFTNNTFIELLLNGIIVMEYGMNNDYNTGFIGVVDMRTISVMDFISKIDFSMHRKIHTIIREGYGFRIKGIHYISSSKLVDNLIALLKPAFPTKVASRMHVHSTHETLYDFIPKELLCMDYGGNAPPMFKLNEFRVKAISSDEHLKHMQKINQCRTDESKRIEGKLEFDYLPGTFRSLAVD